MSELNLESNLIESSQLFSFTQGLLILPPSTVDNGSKLLQPNNSNSVLALATPAPTTLYPTPIPSSLFQQALSVQPLFNTLVDQISLDSEFLLKTLEPLSEVDDFLKNLLKIYKIVLKEGIKQDIRFGLHRSDYLIHYQPTKQEKEIDGSDINEVKRFYQGNLNRFKLYQVEINTIAASFAALSSKTTLLHRHLGALTNDYDQKFTDTDSNIPENHSLKSLVDGLAKAHQLYNVQGSVILMVIQPNERNVFDQRHIELDLFKNYKIKTIRLTFSELSSQAKLDPINHKLVINDLEISVVYFRSGYSPEDYINDDDWKVRLLMEQSSAIKCPSVAYQLVGSKKIQQVLAEPNILERFITSSEDIKTLKTYFTGLYSLDSSIQSQKAIESLRLNPEHYVMKPSREGGGNNLYGPSILAHLDTLTPIQKQAYILMDRILPPIIKNNNLGLRYGLPALKGDFVSELGIYGVFISGEVNKSGGHLLRSKLNSSDEGGVAVGHSVIDSPYLV